MCAVRVTRTDMLLDIYDSVIHICIPCPHTYTYIPIDIQPYTHLKCTNAYPHTHTHTYTHISIHKHLYTDLKFTNAYPHAYTHIYTYTYTYTHTSNAQTHTHIYPHIPIHTYLSTHTYPHIPIHTHLKCTNVCTNAGTYHTSQTNNTYI